MNPEAALALVQRERDIFETANERKGQPRPSNLPTRTELLQSFQAAGKANEQDGLQEPYRIIVGHIYPPSTRPLAELEDIAIGDLCLETVHHGRRLVLRTIGHPKIEDGVINVVEDAHGNVDRLVVYHCGQDILRKDGLVAVKDPYYKIAVDGGCVIRVDHPGNIIVLHEGHEIVPKTLREAELDSLSVDGANMYKERGNKSYQKTDYSQAVRFYSRGLEICDAAATVKYDLRRNRAMANMYLGRHEAALEDAKAAVISTKDLNEKSKKLNGKAYYRAGCAAYQLERFASAASFFENVLELDPKDTEAQSQLRRTKARLDEQASGQYNLELITKKLRKDPKLRILDHASFTSKVEIKDASEKGRGLFATCDLEAGELVMCEKAFCVAGLEEKAEESRVINLLDSTMSIGTHALRLVKVLQKLLYSPKQAARFLELCDGDYQPRPSPALVDGVVPVDTFQVISALKANGFSCPSSASSITMDEEDEGSKCTGVWLISSAINHDCIGNVSRTFLGDMLLLRANRRISAGEELTMRYINPENTIEQFHEQLRRSWNFSCTCRLCTAEVNTPPYQRSIRASLLEQVIELQNENLVLEWSPPSMEIINQVEKLCKGIERTYNDSLFKALPRSMLHVVHLWLCMAYATQSMGDAMLDAARLVLRDLGFGISEHNGTLSVDKSNARLDASGIHAAMYAAQIEEAKGRGGIARQYEELAKELYLLFAGSMFGFAGLFPSVF
ncbi:unnamed protein product [Cercospora beticola]|nr:unnamed protein product [Cercospora beticola]